MGYFPDMFKPVGKGMAAFLLHVGRFDGTMVVYALGEDGKPTEFTCGKAEEVIGLALAELGPHLKVVNHRRYAGRAPEYPYDWGFTELHKNRWAELVRVINHGKGVNAARVNERLLTLLSSLCSAHMPQIQRDGYRGKYKLTEAGMAADAKADAEDAVKAAE